MTTSPKNNPNIMDFKLSPFYKQKLKSLILESRLWDIDIRFKQWFFTTYFSVPDVVEFCLSEKDNENDPKLELIEELMESPLYTIVFSGYPQYIKEILSKADDAVRKSLIENEKIINLVKYPILISTIETNCVSAVSLLLLLRANPRCPNQTGKEPLLVAAEKGNKEIITVLLEYGAQKLKPQLCTKLDKEIRKMVKQPNLGGWWKRKKNKKTSGLEILIFGEKLVGKKTFLNFSSNSALEVPSKVHYFTRRNVDRTLEFNVTVHNTLSSYDKADIIMFFFDLSREHTFISIESWLKKLIPTTTMLILLIGNKMDIKYKELDKRINQTLATYPHVIYSEVSAKYGIGVFDALSKMEQKILSDQI